MNVKAKVAQDVSGMEECLKARAEDQNQIKSSNDANCISRFWSSWPLTQPVLRNAASLVLPNASGKTRKATWDQKMTSRVSCIAYKFDCHLELFSSLPLNSSKWFYWIGCLLLPLDHWLFIFCVLFFESSWLIGFWCCFFLQKSLASIDYHLKMLLLFSLLRLVGGLVAAGYSGHVSWRWWRWGHRVTHHPHASH